MVVRVDVLLLCQCLVENLYKQLFFLIKNVFKSLSFLVAEVICSVKFEL